MRYGCQSIEADLATLAEEQAQVRESLELVREALALRAQFMQLSLCIGINLAAVERRLAEVLNEPALPARQTKPLPTLGGVS